MKLQSPYQSHLFVPMLIGSVLAHGMVLGAGSFFVSPPQFGVQAGPSSMEIVLIEEKDTRTVKTAEDIPVLSVMQPSSQSQETVQKIEPVRKKVRPIPQKSVYIPALHGAQHESMPGYLKNPAPVYPYFAREHGWEGLVLLKVLVQSDGRPEQVEVEKSSGFKILDQSALKAVKKWQFRGARAGNFSFSSWVKVPIRFILTEENNG